ncbi:hypothetical protein [Aquimarina sp. I32.4]|uniref:hypothetical protein n=1 Tax=Aquimarina sp. I32.4 TaxID=2053903 RepID=UPI001E58EEBC|nr:hypothetical protein [Aquimarina sp. I32.4]
MLGGQTKEKKLVLSGKYGRYHGIVYFVGNHPNWTEIKKWTTFLEQESIKRKKYLKAYFVYGNKIGYSKSNRQIELEQLGKELKIENTALTFVPSSLAPNKFGVFF